MTLPDRFMDHVQVDAATGCWLWTGAKNRLDGYGQFWMDGRVHLAHRVAYSSTGNDLPEWVAGGPELDHLCRVRSCVNPDHLELVTGRENRLRGESPVADQSRRTHCPRGHELAEGNLVRSEAARGGRECLLCHRERAREQDAAIRDAHIALGLTQREYVSRYGKSRTVAQSLLDEAQP